MSLRENDMLGTPDKNGAISRAQLGGSEAAPLGALAQFSNVLALEGNDIQVLQDGGVFYTGFILSTPGLFLVEAFGVSNNGGANISIVVNSLYPSQDPSTVTDGGYLISNFNAAAADRATMTATLRAIGGESVRIGVAGSLTARTFARFTITKMA